MIGLLIIYHSLLAIGKIHGQEVIIPQIINVQFLSTVPLISRPAITSDPNLKIDAIQTVRIRSPMQRADYIDRTALKQTGSGLNLSQSLTVREDTLPRRFSTQKVPDRMNRHPTDGSPANTSVGNTTGNASDNRNSVEENPKPVTNLEQVPKMNRNETRQDKTPFVLPAVMNATVVNLVTNKTSFHPVDKNGTKVTFDERSSFDGDQCPTGYVKVNGKCVEAD